MIAFVLYTHSSYDDCWYPFFSRLREHLTVPFYSYYIFSDRISKDIDSKFKPILYQEENQYTDRVLECLERTPEEYLLFCHEDMILYEKTHSSYLQECIETVKKVDVIRLIKGGTGSLLDIQYKDSKILKEIPEISSYLFAIQPSLWNKLSLIRLLKANKGKSIWEFEAEGQEFCRNNSYIALYTYTGEPKRGMDHYDTAIFPYIATAIVKGKWNTLEYSKEIESLSEEFNIDLLIRGKLK